jgi:cell fate regulator YaaT (PSP1 superfamily)
MSHMLLVRYGAVPEVSRFAHDLVDPPDRHEHVVVSTHRGLELGTVLESLRISSEPRIGTNGHSGDQHASTDETTQRVLRRASPEDEARHAELGHEARESFNEWQNRIADWKLDLDLIDLEWTLDRQKLVLYVLGGRGPDTTKLALQAAAAGLAVVEVQPVDANGPVPVPAAGGGCGSGGCGCHDDH